MNRLNSEKLKACEICPRDCGIDGYVTPSKFCGMADGVRISSFRRHYGEEGELVEIVESLFLGIILFFPRNLLERIGTF